MTVLCNECPPSFSPLRERGPFSPEAKSGSPASVYLAYSKSNLCKEHFFAHFEKRFSRTVREFQLLKGVKKLGLALSGGKDSTVLALLLKPLCDQMRIELIAISVDEGIEGYRDRQLAHARKICAQLGIRHEVRSYKEEHGVSMDDVMSSEERDGASCSYCGVFRRWALNKAAKELQVDRLALGHNLDDFAQTILMNIFRNEPQRLARISIDGTGDNSESGDMISRIMPFVRTPEREVALYAALKEMGQPMEDCPYAHEAFRNQVRGVLNTLEEKTPGTKLRVLNSFLAMRPHLHGMKKGEAGANTLTTCAQCGEPSAADVCKRCELRGQFIPLILSSGKPA